MKIKIENTSPNRYMRTAQLPDEQGLVYSKDGKRLLKAVKDQTQITVKEGVKIICDDAFKFVQSAEEIKLPQSVQYLGEGSFCWLDKMKSIILPDSLLYLSSTAFCDTGLTSIVIPDSVVYIGERAFERCKNLESVTLPSGLEEIEDEVFLNCPQLKSVKLGQAENFVLEDGILYNKEKTEVIVAPTPGINVVLPESVKTIRTGAFKRREIESVKLPSGLTTIGTGAFDGCTSLKSVILPDSVHTIGIYAFADCETLDLVQLPDGLESLNNWAFENGKINTLVLPEKLPDEFLKKDPFRNTVIKEIKTKSDRYYISKYVVYDSETHEEVASFQ